MKKLVLLFAILISSIGAFAQVTWSENVAPILFDHCTTCHHEGGIGPSSFMTYDDAYNSSAGILGAITSGQMPPWPADPNYRHLLFQNNSQSFIEQCWPFIEQCHFFKLSEEEALLITACDSVQDAAAALRKKTSAVFAITLGKEGTLFSLEDRVMYWQ